MIAQTCSFDGEAWPSGEAGPDAAQRCDLRAIMRVDMFKALGDVSRLAILASLAEAGRPLRVSEIGTCCPQDLSVVSRHLTLLRDVGVVESERRGREVYYAIRWDDLVGVLRGLADALEQCCADSPERCDDGGAR